MSNTLIILIYCFTIYGFSNMMAFSSGPFKIFENIRKWAFNLSEHFGSLFSCMICLPANLGWIFSLLDWFILNNINITPFNIILYGTNLWWLALILDCCFTSGIVWIIHNIETYFENLGENSTTYQDDNDIINLKD